MRLREDFTMKDGDGFIKYWQETYENDPSFKACSANQKAETFTRELNNYIEKWVKE